MEGLFKRKPSNEEPQRYFPPSPDKFVPNIVHFIRFGKFNMTFIEAVCILAALKNQKPLKLYIHSDQKNFNEVWGKYWEVVTNHNTASGLIEVKYLKMPLSIYGKEFNPTFAMYHASDVERLRILIKYGGIYLDNDSYIVQNLEVFFENDMTLGRETGGGISDQVLIAKRNATFLHLWLDSYVDYRRTEWFYNGGELPTKILRENPNLVHAVPTKLAEYKTIPSLLYYQDTNKWKTHYAIHLLVNHQYMLLRNISSKATYPVEFDEVNILNYPVIIRQMALDVYPFSEKIKNHYKTLYTHLIPTKRRKNKARLVPPMMVNFTSRKVASD